MDTENSSVYEIGYLIASSTPEEKVPGEAEAVKKIITAAGAQVISDEAPHKMKLAYEIRRKTVGGSYDKFNEAYFGWIKFEVGSDVIESIKKSVELHPSILRMLLITTVAPNTYLGKSAPAIAAEINTKKIDPMTGEVAVEDVKVAAPASIEEMDKSIDALVKEV